jgi:hypothetical protein
MMAMRSWVLKSWPEVHWQLPANRKRWPVFQHMGTDIRPDRDTDNQIVGDTVWAVRLDASRVLGVAWEWVALQGRLPAIRDPNGFVTNGTLFDEDGQALDELTGIVRLNRVAHAVPWQGIVARVMRGEASQQASPEAAALLRSSPLALISDHGADLTKAAAPRLPGRRNQAVSGVPLAA